MFKDAAREIRFHPGRVIATIVAIAISVAFMAGVSVFLETSRDAQANATSLYVSSSDILAEPALTGDDPAAMSQEITDFAGKVAAVEGVASTTVLRSGGASLSSPHGDIMVNFYGPMGDAAWADVTQGRLPETTQEIALGGPAAKALGVAVGDTVKAPWLETSFTVVGITNDPSSPLGQTAYVSADSTAVTTQSVLVIADDGVDPASLLEPIKQLGGKDSSVELAATIKEVNAKAITGDFDALGVVLQGFAVISLIVGMIIIANTFNILLTQRRRQIGLLRAIGASSAQVQRKFLAEAILLGSIGSLIGLGLGIGLGAIGAAALDQLSFGLKVPFMGMLQAFLLGLIATVIAAVAPSLRATRVSPMEALQTTPSAARAKRITLTRWVICGLLVAAGAALVAMALTTSKNNIVWAIGGSALLSLGILGAAPIYVPWMIRGLGKLFSFGGPTVRLAAQNGARNPQRAAATATALMLAIGLIVTLQVAISSMGATAIKAVEARYPVDVTVTGMMGPIPEATQKQIAKFNGVADAVTIPSTEIAMTGENYFGSYAVAPGDAMDKMAPNAELPEVTDGVALVSELPLGYAGEKIEISGANGGTIKVVLQKNHFADYNCIVVSATNLTTLAGSTGPQDYFMWLKLTDTDQAASVMTQFGDAGLNGEVSTGGSAIMSYIFTQVINILMAVMSGLMGVAVLIALVGVANTLGLSVIERTRESALLRALGMQRSSLRWMLTVEALFLAAVGTTVGIIAGAFFGWLGSKTAFMMIGNTAGQTLSFSIDWRWTVGLILIAIVSATIASILPGRRAAMATPTEALAAE